MAGGAKKEESPYPSHPAESPTMGRFYGHSDVFPMAATHVAEGSQLAHRGSGEGHSRDHPRYVRGSSEKLPDQVPLRNGRSVL
nr:MAG: hypothetical protein [Bacteriophage sp.]